MTLLLGVFSHLYRFFGGLDRLAVYLLDDITGFEASLGGWGIGIDLGHHHAGDLGGQIELLAGAGVDVGHSNAVERAGVLGV